MIKLYSVDNAYVKFLRQFDKRVRENKSRRPYVGVICMVNGVKYYVPLTSPKPKHRTMKNSKDFHKIKGGSCGAMNFNNMIPVSDSDLSIIDINNEPDIAYKHLLKSQYFELIKIEKEIRSKANKLYLLTQTHNDNLSTNDRKVKARCCNFIMLEEKLAVYVASKQQCL